MQLKLSVILLLSALCACGISKNGGRQTTPPSPESKALYDTVFRLDSVLFHAFNTCDVETFSKFLTDDIEFYHDESGLMVSSKTQSDGLLIRCAEQDKNGELRRELVKGSLEVYPLPNYGALEVGEHNFYRTLPGEKEKLTTTAKFTNIWQKTNGEWKISRIISYGHQSVK